MRQYERPVPRVSILSANRQLLIFARAPILGQVKTRLQPALPNSDIVLLHEKLVHRAIATAMKVPDSAVQLWVDVQPQHPFFRRLITEFPSLSVCQQRGSDLGARMHAALNDALRHSHQAVLIGSDCPALTRDYLQQAFACLSGGEARTGHDVVLGPATDGGYVLLGSSVTDLPIFHGIEWGASTVFDATIRRLREAGMPHATLAPLSDIDRPEDLHIARQYGLLSGRD